MANPLVPRRMTNVLWRAQHYVDFRAGMPDPARDERNARLEHVSARQPTGRDAERPGAGGGGLAPGWGLIGTGAFSASSSISRDGVFTATYRTYVLYVVVDSATSSGGLRLQFRAAAVNTTTGYDWSLDNDYSSSTSDPILDVGANTSSISLGYLANATINGFANVTIVNPGLAKRVICNSQYSYYDAVPPTLLGVLQGGGGQRATTVFDGFRLFPSVGTMTGEYWLFGTRKV